MKKLHNWSLNILTKALQSNTLVKMQQEFPPDNRGKIDKEKGGESITGIDKERGN